PPQRRDRLVVVHLPPAERRAVRGVHRAADRPGAEADRAYLDAAAAERPRGNAHGDSSRFPSVGWVVRPPTVPPGVRSRSTGLPGSTSSTATTVRAPPTNTRQVSGSPYSTTENAVTHSGWAARMTAAGTGRTCCWANERARKPRAQATSARWSSTAQS